MREAAEELAAWCVTTGQPPDVFHILTRTERRAFYDAARRQRR